VLPAGATDAVVKKVLRQAICRSGDAVVVERWETANDGQGQCCLEDLGAPVRVCTYSNVKVNEPVPSEAFKLKTDGKTTYSTH
jgi:hypothetical protein